MKITKHLPHPIKVLVRGTLHFFGRYKRRSYSQEGEDIVLSRFLEGQKSGFYVDIGAHHPSRCSNTYLFYRLGWRGINIDAMPGSMAPFRLARPRDINLEVAVSDKKEEIAFHSFKEPLFNSADPKIAASRRKEFHEPASARNTFNVEADTLASILDRHLPKSTPIDFLSVDIEGLDLKALRSNDWEKYQPNYVLVEILGESIGSLPSTEICTFLSEVGYEPVSKLVHTVIFRKKSLGRIKHF